MKAPEKNESGMAGVEMNILKKSKDRYNEYKQTFKNMFTRMNVEGRIGNRYDFGWTERWKMNVEKDKENMYDLDDAFIDDGNDEEQVSSDEDEDKYWIPSIDEEEKFYA